MKKSIIIFCALLATLSLTAFGFINWNETESCQISKSSDLIEASDFFLAVGPRFGAIKKEEIDQLSSMTDLLSDDHAQDILSYKTVSVIILDDATQTDKRETGYNEVFTPEQIKLLRSSEYSTNILFRADYIEKNTETGEMIDSYTTPHLTIIPENQAEYSGGKAALIKYLRDNSKDKLQKLEKDKLQPGKLYFTVNTNGCISDLVVSVSSGYAHVDELIIDLMNDLPGKWKPAKNAEGIHVIQKLVISFGIMGC